MMEAVPDGYSTHGPFVGRQADLDRLTAVVGVASDAPEGVAVLLAGEAGVGKTRLISELLAVARRGAWRLCVGHCSDLGDSALPYQPFIEVFGQLAVESPALVESLIEARPAVSRLIPGRRDAGGDGLGPRVDRGELFEAVHASLTQLSRVASLLLVIEDVHWADRSTREMLSYLFARPGPDPVVIVCSYRSDDLHRRHPLRATVGEWARLPGVSRFQLSRLADADVRTLVRALHPAPIREADVHGIVDRAEGNPFFVEELVAAAEMSGRLLPEDLSALLLVRLDQLDEPVRQVVRAASVAGRSVPHELLAAVVGVEATSLDQLLRVAVEANVLVTVSSEGYAFRHALLSEAIYGDLLPGERVRTHAAYVQALSAAPTLGSAAELARHARGAQDLPTALRASVIAGDEAMALGGPDDAARHYELALELVAQVGGTATIIDQVDVVGLVLRASEATVAAGHPFRGLALVQDQLDHLAEAGTAEQRVRLLHAVANIALLLDTGMDVLQMTTEALKLLPDEPAGPLRARLLSVHARAHADRRRDDEAARWAREALDLAKVFDLSDVAADAATTLAWLEQRAGDPNASRRNLERTISEARAAGEVGAELRSLYNLGTAHYEAGRMPEALVAFQTAMQRAHDNGRPWAPYGVDARMMLGVVGYVNGDWDDVLRITDISSESPPALAEAALAAVALAVAAGRGNLQALDLLPRLRSWWERDGLRSWWERDGLIAILSGTAAIDLYGDRGDIDAATAVHDDVVASVGEMWQSPDFQARIRLSGLLLGQLSAEAARSGISRRAWLVDRADELAASATAAAAAADQFLRVGSQRGLERDAWFARVTAEHCRIRWLSGRDAPAEDELVRVWEQSVLTFERFGHRFETARSRARWSSVLRAVGRPEEAAQQAEKARQIAERLGARPLLDELRLLGPGPPEDRTKRSRTEEALTAREHEVLRLLAVGRSNRDIGQQLFISAKTVSVHVSNILAKLGASGRTEAVAIARRRRLLASDQEL